MGALIEARMIHSCQIETLASSAGTTDEYGIGPADAPTYATTKCLFSVGGQLSKGGTKVLESGQHIQSLPTILLPASAAIAEGQRLIGQSAGWLSTYVVRKVYPIWSRVLDHYRCDLEAVS